MRKKTTALYPGTFDILTYGHLDLIKRGAKLFDELIVGIAQNKEKEPFFSIEKRRKMLKVATKHLSNVKVVVFQDLTVRFARKYKVRCIIRGLRAVSDFEYELQMAFMNQSLAPGIDSIFLAPALEYSFLSSSLVKEVAMNHGDVSKFVPPVVERYLKEKISKDVS